MRTPEPVPDKPESTSAGEITALLRRGNADENDRNRLVALVYPELRRLAERHMRGERPDHTLRTSGLINEFFLDLARQEGQVWQNRSHFLAAASQAMRGVC